MPESKIKSSLIATPQRQSILGVVVYMLRNFRAMIALFLSLLAVAASNPAVMAIALTAAIPVAILFSVVAYYQYYNFTFQVVGTELIIHKGIFFKDRLVVEAERIQSIQITQNIIQRLLGLVGLRVDTAGSKGSELEIPALKREIADELKALLYAKKAEEKRVSEGAEASSKKNEALETDHVLQNHGKAEKVKEEVEVGDTLVSLGIFDLLKVGLTENHLKTGAIALAFVFGTFSQYQEFIAQYFKADVDEYASQAVNAGMRAVAFFLLLYALISVGISLVRTLLRFFNLKAVLKSDAIDIETGLLKRDESRVPIRKIQYIQWETNPLRSLIGFESARLKPSNSLGEVAGQDRIEIPALKFRQSEMLRDAVFDQYADPELRVEIDPFGYARLALIATGLFLTPGVGSLVYFQGWEFAAILGILPIIFLFGLLYGRSVSIDYDDNYILIRKGWFFKERVVIPSYKIQTMSIQQNIFIFRRGLCHLKISTAAGSKSVRYLKFKECTEMYDKLLYTVEKSTKDWM